MSRPARAMLDDFIGREHSATSALLWPGGEMPLGTPTMVLPQSGYRAWNNAFEMRKGHWQGQAGRQCYTLLCFCKGLPQIKAMVWGVSMHGTLQATHPDAQGSLYLELTSCKPRLPSRIGAPAQKPAATSSISGGASSPLLLERLRQ